MLLTGKRYIDLSNGTVRFETKDVIRAVDAAYFTKEHVCYSFGSGEFILSIRRSHKRGRHGIFSYYLLRDFSVGCRDGPHSWILSVSCDQSNASFLEYENIANTDLRRLVPNDELDSSYLDELVSANVIINL